MGETKSFEGQLLLTAQAGSSVRLEALVRGAANRARVAMEYFILVFLVLFLFAFWLENSLLILLCF